MAREAGRRAGAAAGAGAGRLRATLCFGQGWLRCERRLLDAAAIAAGRGQLGVVPLGRERGALHSAMNASEQGPESEEEREYALFLRWWHEGHKDYWGNPFQAAWQAWRERSARKEPQER